MRRVETPLSQESAAEKRLVYHGSPHAFDAFSLAYVGTGEGASDFGWGLYFAEHRGVARNYTSAEITTGAPVPTLYLLNGQRTCSGTPEQKAADLVHGTGLARARKLAADMLRDARRGDDWTLRNGLAWYEKVHELTQQIQTKREVKPAPGRLYVAAIPGDESYLLWDVSLADQPHSVQALFKIHPDITDKSVTGAVFYRELAKKLGSQRAASEHLFAQGVTGVRYTDKVNHAFNYVVFDDSAVTMLDAVNASIKAEALIKRSAELQAALQQTAAQAQTLTKHLKRK